jgi:hypothetical protein
MWRVLRKFGIPEKFIKVVQTMYKGATTSIMVNGILSKPYKVKRGVRQGCAASCALFDIAIEPLAEALRKSRLNGFNIPGVAERILTTLFADDTSVFINEKDNIKDLTDTIDLYCTASTAKFNMTKTTCIPIGTKEYRENMLETRQINEHSTVPEAFKLLKEGECVRLLGGWVGNNINQSAP